jgi:hypothetical protein
MCLALVILRPEGATGFSPGFQPWVSSKIGVRPVAVGATGCQVNFASIVAQVKRVPLRGATIGPLDSAFALTKTLPNPRCPHRQRIAINGAAKTRQSPRDYQQGY